MICDHSSAAGSPTSQYYSLEVSMRMSTVLLLLNRRTGVADAFGVQFVTGGSLHCADGAGTCAGAEQLHS